MTDPNAGTFATTVAVDSDPTQPQVRSSGPSARSAGLPLIQIVGLSFLASGAYGLYVLLSYGSPGAAWLVSGAFIAASFYAALRILQFDERGRSLGLLLAFLGIVYGLFLLAASASGLSLALMAVDAFVIWVLMTSKDFERR